MKIILAAIERPLIDKVMAQAPGILAQIAEVYEPGQRSLVLGTQYYVEELGALALLLGVLIFIGSWVVVFRARQLAVIASYSVFLLLPLLLAAAGALRTLVAVLSVWAMSESDLKQRMISGLLSEVLAVPLRALLVTIPSFIVLAVGLFIRTLKDTRPESGL